MKIMSDNRLGWSGRDDWRDNRDNDWRLHRHTTITITAMTIAMTATANSDLIS